MLSEAGGSASSLMHLGIPFPLCTFLSALSRCFSRSVLSVRIQRGTQRMKPPWLLPVAAEALRQLSEQLQPRPLPPQGPQSPLCSPSKRSLPSWTSAALMETTTLYVPLSASLIICKASRIGLLLCSLLTYLWVAKSLVWGGGPRSLPVLLLLDELHSLGKSILFSLSFKFFIREMG